MNGPHCVVCADEVPGDSRHGAEIRALLGPKSVGATSGFMGVCNMKPGEVIREHYHPYSEEFVFLVSGTLVAKVDGVDRDLHARDALFIPINLKHRFANQGQEDAFMVFSLSPLAPRPDLGHVSTEEAPA
ncbi:MAG: putative monooxygenase [Acidimicrobiaceae bacterium]|jgi:putative monooxygenase|nr:putative monooxygenase [Acidimicrobiaceae bacterium]MDQ1444784.1 putative monooxygenase [Acidimicrobiaceae bacterium]